MVGAEHVTEAVSQLRGNRGEGQVKGAEVALVTGLGVPDHATLVLTHDPQRIAEKNEQDDEKKTYNSDAPHSSYPFH